MTEEEMAEEWIKEHSGLIGSYKFVKYDYDSLKQAFLAGLKAGKPKWYKLSEKYPEADKLVRVRLMSGMEHICETCYYEPTEDEIGYGKLVITFYELNGEWVDDNDIIAWCEIPQFKDDVTQAYQKGAEFGYNKAKEEMQEQGLALQSDMDKTIEQNIALKKQIEKMKCCYNCRHSRTECEHNKQFEPLDTGEIEKFMKEVK